jgi:hypothetical protein
MKAVVATRIVTQSFKFHIVNWFSYFVSIHCDLIIIISISLVDGAKLPLHCY